MNKRYKTLIEIQSDLDQEREGLFERGVDPYRRGALMDIIDSIEAALKIMEEEDIQ